MYWGYWVVLEDMVVLGIKKEYCGALHGTAGYYWVQGGTGVHRQYWLVLRVLGGFGGTEGYQRVFWRTFG